MKTLFLKTKYRDIVVLGEDNAGKLPERIALASSIQYIDSIKEVKSELENKGKKVILLQGDHSKHKGQILGCDVTGITIKSIEKKKFDAFLYIGDGEFHPKILLLAQKERNKDVFLFNPMNRSFRKIEHTDIEKIEKKNKGALLKFHTSANIGIIVSTKPGQERLKKAIELKKRLTKMGKNSYIFICNTLNPEELENFNFVDCYINTMCPRIGFDDIMRYNKPVINYGMVEESLGDEN